MYVRMCVYVRSCRNKCSIREMMKCVSFHLCTMSIFTVFGGANCMLPPSPCSKVNVDCVTVSTIPVKSAIEGHIQHLFDALLTSLRRSIQANITAIDDFLKTGNEALSVRPQTIEEIGEVNVKHSELSQSKPKVWATKQCSQTRMKRVFS